MAPPPLTSRLLGEMPTTAFEQLASRILRFHPRYESLIPVGLNDKGRPVPGPADAICWPNTNPPQGVLFAYTATDRKKLRDKWLFDPALAPRRKTKSPEGDVVKNLRRAEEIRREIPQAALTLVLACAVDPPEPLATTVKARCLAPGVDVDFWAASRLVEFLDSDPHGQRLRQGSSAAVKLILFFLIWTSSRRIRSKTCGCTVTSRDGSTIGDNISTLG